MKKKYLITILAACTIPLIVFHSCVNDIAQPVTPPYTFHQTEGFEGSTSLPAGWKIFNPDNDAKWEVVTTAAHTGSNCIGFNNCSGNGNADMTGKTDRLISPSYDFSKATNVNLTFDVAYAFLYFKNQEYPDTLAIYSSINGGVTWDSLYLKSGSDLSNIAQIMSSPPCWSPTIDTDWRTDFILLNHLAGQPNVMFAFENRSAWGQWIYIDNITINAVSGATDCDKITYTNDILPIIEKSCSTTGCHVPNGSAPSDYTTFEGVKGDVDNGSFKRRVVDGKPNFMPPAGKLDSDLIDKVNCWLNAGAPNN